MDLVIIGPKTEAKLSDGQICLVVFLKKNFPRRFELTVGEREKDRTDCAGMEALRSENEELRANLAESRKYAQEVRSFSFYVWSCAFVCVRVLRLKKEDWEEDERSDFVRVALKLRQRGVASNGEGMTALLPGSLGVLGASGML